MSEKRFTWKTEKLQHFDDEVLLVVDNENKEWKGHILNIVDKLNEQQLIISKLDEDNTYYMVENLTLKKENEHLKKRLYDFEKRKIIEESEIDEDVIPKVKLLRAELFGEKYE